MHAFGVEAPDRPAAGLEHDAFLYGSDDDYAGTLIPLLHAAVAAGDAAIAVVPQHNEDLLRAALGSSADDVEFIAAETWYEHPARTIARYDAVLAELTPRSRPFVVGEVRFGDSAREHAAWVRYEAALNDALAHRRARVVCPYDVRALPPFAVDAARRTHPHLVEAASRRPSADYADPATYVTRLPATVELPARVPDLDRQVSDSPREVRQDFAALAGRTGFDADRIAALTLAVSEVVANALRHGGGSARVRAWAAGAGAGGRGGELVCAVEDRGPGVDDALLGLRPPAPDDRNGHGLWLARQVFDGSDLVRPTGGGLTVLLSASA